MFNIIMKVPLLTVLGVIAIFWSMKFVLPYIGSDFMNDSDEDKITVKIVMPQGSTIERTLEVSKVIEKRIEKIPEQVSYLTTIGDNGVENAAVVVNLKSHAERQRSDLDIINALIPFMATIPDAEITLMRGEARGGLDADVSINLHGIDYEKMIGLSKLMKKKMEETGFFRAITSSYRVPKNEIRFIPDRKKLIEYGLNNTFIGSVVRASVYGDDSNIYKENGEEYDINVELDNLYAEHFDDIRKINVITKKGLIPVTRLGQLVEEKGFPMIRHRDKVRVIRLEGDISKGSLGYVKKVLDKSFKEIPFERGYGYAYVGTSEYQEESGREIGKAFMIAVILTFMLLAAIMNSFLYPIPIILSVATSFIGVFLGLFFSGVAMNVMSMLTMVMLVGLVVNNSILILDYAMQKMNEGVELVEAIWLGVSEKFRAIIMTSLAIILGVAPQLYSIMAVKVSMAVVMISGMLASIVFTFILTPVTFYYAARFRKLFVRT